MSYDYDQDLMDQMNKNQNIKSFTKGKGILDVPKGVKTYRLKEGRNKLNILLYVVTTENHPNGIEKGKRAYVIIVPVHRGIGPLKDDYICLKLFGEVCPLCEELERLKTKESLTNEDQEVKNLFTSFRALYNVMDKEEQTDDEGKPLVQIFEASYKQFEKELYEAATENEEGQGTIPFASLKSGKIVSFRTSKEKYPGGEYLKPKDFRFLERNQQFSEKILDYTYPLDSLIIKPNPEDMMNSLYGLNAPEEESSEEGPVIVTPPKKDKPVAPKADWMEEANKTVEQVTEGPTEEEPPSETEQPKEETVLNGTEKEDPPAQTEPETPPTEEGPKCPHGYKFGYDAGEKVECAECPTWDDCDDLKHEREKEERRKRLGKQ